MSTAVHLDYDTHIYRNDEGTVIHSVNQVLTMSGIAQHWESHASEIAKRTGTSVHWATRLLDEDGLPKGWTRAKGSHVLNYVTRYQEWKERTGFVPLQVERPFIQQIIYCGRRLFYAGTPDRFGKFPDGTFAVVDLKTGKTVPDWVRYQLSGYTAHFGGIWAIRRIAVRLSSSEAIVKEFPKSSARHDWSKFAKALHEVSK